MHSIWGEGFQITKKNNSNNNTGYCTLFMTKVYPGI